MLSRLIALFSIVSFISVQTPCAFSLNVVPTMPAGQTSVAPATTTVTVPSGTVIPLTLINPIKNKSTKPGDAVRATVAFPIMAGMQVAIPAGSYVEGVVQTVTARASDTHQTEVGIHFTRLVFANGFSVALDANSAQAEEVAPNLGVPGLELASLTPPASNMGLFAQSTPTLPPQPQVGPPMGVVIGAVLGGGAAIMITMLAVMHHSQSKIDYVLFDAGWQFQMILQSPLIVDTGRAATAPAPSSEN
jgi:hypothetical protein